MYVRTFLLTNLSNTILNLRISGISRSCPSPSSLSDHFLVLHVAPVCTDGDIECPIQAFKNFKITLSHWTDKERLMADCVFKFLHCILYSMCTELSTTFSAIQKKLVWVRYLLGTEPEGMILHNTKKLFCTWCPKSSEQHRTQNF